MSNFIQKSIIKSMLANLPKMFKSLTGLFIKEDEKYTDDFVIMITVQEDDLYSIPGVVNKDNVFFQKEIEIKGKKYKAMKLAEFIQEQVDANL